jgi:hypothetical protein
MAVRLVQLGDVRAQKSVAAESKMRERRVVDIDDRQRCPIVQPHRELVSDEQRAEWLGPERAKRVEGIVDRSRHSAGRYSARP